MNKMFAAVTGIYLAFAATAVHAAPPVIACDPLEELCDDGDGGDGGLGGVNGPGTGTVPGKGGSVTPTGTPAASTTTTLNFNGVGATPNGYTESGFSFATVSGTILGGFGAYGTRGIGVLGPLAAAYVPGPANILQLTRTDGGFFTIDSFFSVVAGPGTTPAGVETVNTTTVTGFVNGVQGNSSTTTSTFFGFGFPQASGLAGVYNKVLFDFSTTSSSTAFDNLTVTAVAAPVTPAVPEPATWGMMILGFGTMGYAMRRRAKVRTTISFV